VVIAGKRNTTSMLEPTRSLNCAIPSPGNTARDKLYAFALKAMARLAPAVKCRYLVSTQTGDMPWDFRETVRYGTKSCGFEIKTVASAFDTSVGIKESFEVEVTSVGLPEAAAFRASYYHGYNSSGHSISADFDVPPALCDELAILLLYAFDA